MTRFQVEVLPDAEAEFREAFLWYFERSPVFADALRIEVLEKIDGLEVDADSDVPSEASLKNMSRSSLATSQRLYSARISLSAVFMNLPFGTRDTVH